MSFGLQRLTQGDRQPQLSHERLVTIIEEAISIIDQDLFGEDEEPNDVGMLGNSRTGGEGPPAQ